MLNTRISLYSVYQAYPDFFAGCVMPPGMDDYKAQLIGTIIHRYGDYTPIHTDITFLRYSIETWFSCNKYSIAGLYKTTVLDYNPIYNKDGTVEETRTPNITITSQGRAEGKVSADNVTEYSPNELNTDNAQSHTGGTEQTMRREYGNIGVTTTQAMIDAERKTVIFNWINKIAELFAVEFLILVL